MTEAVESLLRERIEKDKKRGSPYVFFSRTDPTKPIGSVRKAHNAAIENAGIKDHFRLYDLRHTFATRAANSGVDLPDAGFDVSGTRKFKIDDALRTSSGRAEASRSREVGDLSHRRDVARGRKKSGSPHKTPHSRESELMGRIRMSLKTLAGPTRLELATSCVTGRRSNRLNYGPAWMVPGWWAVSDLNAGPSGCKPDALTAELTAPRKPALESRQLPHSSRFSGYLACIQSRGWCTGTA